MQQTLQELPLTLAYIGADLLAITLLVGVLYIPRHGRRDLVARRSMTVRTYSPTVGTAACWRLSSGGCQPSSSMRRRTLASHSSASARSSKVDGALCRRRSGPVYEACHLPEGSRRRVPNRRVMEALYADAVHRTCIETGTKWHDLALFGTSPETTKPLANRG